MTFMGSLKVRNPNTRRACVPLQPLVTMCSLHETAEERGARRNNEEARKVCVASSSLFTAEQKFLVFQA